jgi:hypothetical protein
MTQLVTITQDNLDQLLDDKLFLDCLIHAGVDNWFGYSDAVEEYERQTTGWGEE